jgi:hypothetical protein
MGPLLSGWWKQMASLIIAQIPFVDCDLNPRRISAMRSCPSDIIMTTGTRMSESPWIISIMTTEPLLHRRQKQ